MRSDVRGRAAAMELPDISRVIPDLDLVLKDRRTAVINGEQPIQSHRVLHPLQNTNAQWLSGWLCSIKFRFFVDYKRKFTILRKRFGQ